MCAPFPFRPFWANHQACRTAGDGERGPCGPRPFGLTEVVDLAECFECGVAHLELNELAGFAVGQVASDVAGTAADGVVVVPGALGEQAAGAVSYTHLTLPTSDLV